MDFLPSFLFRVRRLIRFQSLGGIFEQANPILDLSSLDALVVIGSFLLSARDGLVWITETCKLIAVIFVLFLTKYEL